MKDADGSELARIGFGGEDEKNSYLRRGSEEYFAVDKMRMTGLTDAIKAVIDAVK